MSILVEIGKYYLLNPKDYGKIIGKCVGFTHPRGGMWNDDTSPIFEFEYKDACGKFVNGKNAFSLYNVEEIATEELRNYKINKILK